MHARVLRHLEAATRKSQMEQQSSILASNAHRNAGALGPTARPTYSTDFTHSLSLPPTKSAPGRIDIIHMQPTPQTLNLRVADCRHVRADGVSKHLNLRESWV